MNDARSGGKGSDPAGGTTKNGASGGGGPAEAPFTPDDPEAFARNLGNTGPDAEIVWLEDTIHDAPLQRPHTVAEHIRRFMEIVG